MSRYSVAEARNGLSGLIDRALRGEEVVITRHGQAVVELRSVAPPAQPVTVEAIDWLAAHRVGEKAPADDAGALLGAMRDEKER